MQKYIDYTYCMYICMYTYIRSIHIYYTSTNLASCRIYIVYPVPKPVITDKTIFVVK